jgi:hypothetical protein
MNSQVFSRSYLQNKPEEEKKFRISSVIQSFIHQLVRDAEAGKTLYFYNIEQRIRACATSYPPPPPPLTIDDLLSGFREKFPDCLVSYQENWVDVGTNMRHLKKGILIDWS